MSPSGIRKSNVFRLSVFIFDVPTADVTGFLPAAIISFEFVNVLFSL